MKRTRHAASLLLAGLVTTACAPAPSAAPAGPAPAASLRLPPSPLTPEQRILHVLHRLGYGPRPGDVERVRRTGLAAHIERQLDPGGIPDPVVEAALADYPVLARSTAELARDYPPPAPEVVRRLADGGLDRRGMRELYPAERRPAVIASQLQAARVTRAVLAERQLEEVMVGFWFNHFNVYARKGAVRWMAPAYEREAIRPHALGRFRDLVVATARHPAMLFYLDNWLSTRADLVARRGPAAGRPLGLNENYARELLELHTLGVDGGYSQQDVIEVARCFTGWSIGRPREGGGFVFRPLAHDRGAKRVLGHTIPPGGGEDDGVRVIDILVRHPSTARFVSAKLVRRFVSDDPPAGLVERAAATFRQSDGDIRAVLATVFTSPEFWSADAYRAKIKTPLEVVASAVRALDGRLAAAGERGGAAGGLALAAAVGRLGEPLYEAEPPTGYPDRAEAWVNAGALLGRMNFALDLARNRLPGVRVDLAALLAGLDRSRPAQALDRLLAVVLHGEASPGTRAVLAAQLERSEITRVTADDRGPRDTDVETLTALVLGAAEFQRR